MREFPLGGGDVSLSVRDMLKEHLPAQLAAGPRVLPEPTSYEQVPTEDAIRRVFGSTLAVVTRGTNSRPDRRADGTYDLIWDVVILVWHQQTPQMPLLTAAGDYAAAIRQVIGSHCPALAQSIDYDGEDIDLVGDGLTDQTLGMAMVRATVRTGSVALFTPTPDLSGPVVLTTDVQHNPT